MIYYNIQGWSVSVVSVCQPQLLAWFCPPVLLVLHTVILTPWRGSSSTFLLLSSVTILPEEICCLHSLDLSLLQVRPSFLLKPCSGLSHCQADSLKVTDTAWTALSPGSEASLAVRHKAVHHILCVNLSQSVCMIIITHKLTNSGAQFVRVVS